MYRMIAKVKALSTVKSAARIRNTGKLGMVKKTFVRKRMNLSNTPPTKPEIIPKTNAIDTEKIAARNAMDNTSDVPATIWRNTSLPQRSVPKG
jgi:hypothetical protein